MGDKTMPVTGGFLCGAVRYEAEAFLHNASYCHCRMCQRASGSAVWVGVFIRPETLRFTSGEPKYYQSSPFGIAWPLPNLAPRYNVAPTQDAPVVRQSKEGGERELAGRKQPYRITLTDGAPFAFAGLWEHWTGPTPQLIRRVSWACFAL